MAKRICDRCGYGYERIDIDECVADYVYDRDIDKLFTKCKN